MGKYSKTIQVKNRQISKIIKYGNTIKISRFWRGYKTT